MRDLQKLYEVRFWPGRRHQSDKKEKEHNRASLKRIIDSTIFCGENEIPLRGHWATDGRKPFRKEERFSSVARVQIKLTQRSENAQEKLY
ncbi:hypothetical protein J6590_048659 [Homalodisca vitripennis]|nr:hypothetical protein J6590_103241 [Homalodisca vitripennis]KAG8321314.1 hypothetical protein J6590_048659 [Homalodisca vitripennis]